MKKHIMDELREDLSEEREAKRGYDRLSKEMRRKGLKRSARTVKSIAKDEADHFRLLSKIKKKCKRK